MVALVGAMSFNSSRPTLTVTEMHWMQSRTEEPWLRQAKHPA